MTGTTVMEELKLAFYMSINLFLASAPFVYPLKT